MGCVAKFSPDLSVPVCIIIAQQKYQQLNLLKISFNIALRILRHCLLVHLHIPKSNFSSFLFKGYHSFWQ